MRRFVPLLVAFALLTSACSALGAAPAATVGSTKISTGEIEEEMDAIRGNRQYTDVLEQTYGLPTQGSAGTGTFDAAFVAQVLSLRVWYQLVEDDLAARGVLPIPDDLLAESRAEIVQQFDSLDPEAFESFPASYQDRLIEQRALLVLVEQEILAEIGDDERRFYDANPDEFTEICISHALVGVQGRTPAEAQQRARALAQRIADGEDFTAIATDESDDPGAAAQGGQLGCGTRRQLQFDPTFEAAAFDLEDGVVSEPVQTQFGSHLILVTERRVLPYAEVRESVRLVMAEARDTRVSEHVVNVICAGSVTVNPRYGTWSDEACDGPVPRLPRVEPPAGPRGGS